MNITKTLTFSKRSRKWDLRKNKDHISRKQNQNNSQKNIFCLFLQNIKFYIIFNFLIFLFFSSFFLLMTSTKGFGQKNTKFPNNPDKLGKFTLTNKKNTRTRETTRGEEQVRWSHCLWWWIREQSMGSYYSD